MLTTVSLKYVVHLTWSSSQVQSLKKFPFDIKVHIKVCESMSQDT